MTNLVPPQPFQGFSSGGLSTATTDPLQAYTNIQLIQPVPTQSAWQPEAPEYYFEEASHREYFRIQRKTRQMHNAANRPGPNWTEADELKLVDLLWREWFDEPYPGASWQFEDLNLDALETKPLRKYDLRPFKINYETYQEIKLRLLNTVISIKGHPFLVQKIAQTPQGFKLAVSDGLKTKTVLYKDLTDLRSIPPMYVNGSHGPGWMCRIPGRVYQQGMNRQNTVLKAVDGKATLSALDATHFVKTFNKRTMRQWSSTLKSLLDVGELPGVRLSDEVAVKSEKGKILACYRGRFLGTVNDNDVIVGDDDDLLQQWIERSVKEVGLELRA